MLKRGGLLFHYIPRTGSRYRGRDVRRGVIDRLRDSGFVIIGQNDYGVLARKI
jgi:Predicted archaeal methyltransferase